MRYAAKTAIVTGAASGIGAAAVRRLHAEGARVGLIDIDGEQARAVAGEVAGAVAELDVTDIPAIPDAVEGLAEELGDIDLLVNCAGWDVAMPFVDTGPDFWRKVIEINLLGPIAVTHAALSRMAAGSAIVNVASDAGRVGSSGEVVYSGAKGGIIGFSKALAREVANRRMRVNVVSPGPTDTPFLASFDDSGRLAAAMERQTPLRKLATPDDIAAAISFLGSAEAGHITGQVLSVSGGLTMV